MPALQIENLFKRYEKTEAVKGVSFQIENGEIFGLLGPNGAGKTSIISILSTLESPTSGTAKVFGEDVTTGRAKTFLGVVPQEIISHGFFSVEEVLEFHSGYYGIRNNQARIRFLLDRLGLMEHRYKRVRQLSGGLKRRLLIAKALVHNPKLLLLDEPTAGVDVELRNSLWEFVRELNREGVAVLLTTHYLEEAENLCTRVGVIDRGKLLRVGETQGLIKELTQRFVRLTLTKALAPLKNQYVCGQSDTEIRFRVPTGIHLGQLLKEIPVDAISDIAVKEGTLEDAFLNLVEKR